jgi:hypothetical protein
MMISKEKLKKLGESLFERHFATTNHTVSPEDEHEAPPGRSRRLTA